MDIYIHNSKPFGPLIHSLSLSLSALAKLIPFKPINKMFRKTIKKNTNTFLIQKKNLHIIKV